MGAALEVSLAGATDLAWQQLKESGMSDDRTDLEVGTDLRLSADPLAAFGDSALGHAVLRVLRTRSQDAEMPIAAFQDSL